MHYECKKCPQCGKEELFSKKISDILNIAYLLYKP